jgi:hypothetical protein
MQSLLKLLLVWHLYGKIQVSSSVLHPDVHSQNQVAVIRCFCTTNVQDVQA